MNRGRGDPVIDGSYRPSVRGRELDELSVRPTAHGYFWLVKKQDGADQKAKNGSSQTKE